MRKFDYSSSDRVSVPIAILWRLFNFYGQKTFMLRVWGVGGTWGVDFLYLILESRLIWCNWFLRQWAWRAELMQWRKHVRIKYGGRVGVGQGQREQGQLQVRVVQLQGERGGRLSYVCHQPQRRTDSPTIMLCCGRRKVRLPLTSFPDSAWTEHFLRAKFRNTWALNKKLEINAFWSNWDSVVWITVTEDYSIPREE